MGYKLRSITISGFRSILGPESASFPESGSVIVKGYNQTTGGSSASGKSSFLLAIAYALGYCPIPATELKSWSADSMSVELELSGDHSVIIKRSPGKSSLVVDGKTVKGNIDEELSKLLGLKPELLKVLSYRAQRKPGLFLSLGDSEKKEFLSQIIGTEPIEALVESKQALAKACEAEAVALAKEAHVCAATLTYHKHREVDPSGEQELQLSNAVAAAIISLEEAKVAAAKADERYQAAEAAYSAANTKLYEAAGPPDEGAVLSLKEKIAMTLKMQAQVLAEAKEKALKNKGVLAELRKKVTSCNSELSKQFSYEKEIGELQRELTYMDKSGLCSTCEQPLAGSPSIAIKKLEKQSKIDELFSKIEAMGDIRSEVSQLEREIEEASVEVEDARVGSLQEIEVRLRKELQEELDRLAKESQRRAAEHIASLAQFSEEARFTCAEKRDTVLASYSREHELTERKRKLASFLEEKKASLRAIEEAAAQCAAADAKYALKSKEASLNLDLAWVLGREGFLGSIFEELLDEISEETNRVLAVIPNTAHCVIRFDSETVTQKGSTKRTIVPVITIGGNQAKISTGCSGGMYSAVEFAVDLAIGEVVKRRHGACPGWLILDETFDGLGPVEKESCLEMLKWYSQDRLLLVVDHASEVKEMFDNEIQISYDGVVSKIS